MGYLLLMWHITMSTQSGQMMTVAILVGFIPTLVLAPFGGCGRTGTTGVC